jgi:hypothetical protein
MLFEKIEYLVSAHFKEKDKLVRSSISGKQDKQNEHLSMIDEHKKIKPYFKNLVSLTRIAYQDLLTQQAKEKVPSL